VVSEQGDTKRAIGVYGTTINIAARMEEAAKTHNIACAISGDVATSLVDDDGRLRQIATEKVRGSAVEIPIFEYRAVGEACGAPDPAASRSASWAGAIKAADE
jgi:class 3 adenylate cyclase